MRKYISVDRFTRGYYFVLGNGTRDFLGWPIDICVSSYGWWSKGQNKDGTLLWADSNIQIEKFRFAWQFWVGKTGLPYVKFQFEKA